MKKYLNYVAVLTLICLFWTALLAGVNELTRERIAAAAQQKELAAVVAVLPERAPPPVARAFGGVTNYVSLDVQGHLAGAAIRATSPSGYSGDITLMVGFRPDGAVNTYEVLQHSETPGLGARIATPEFKDRIAGRPAATRWQVTKDGGEIDALTAATISSRAVLAAIGSAQAQFGIIRQGVAEGGDALP